MSSEWRISIPLFVLPLDIFSRVVLHHRGGDQGQDRADENVDSDSIGGVIFYEQPSSDQWCRTTRNDGSQLVAEGRTTVS